MKIGNIPTNIRKSKIFYIRDLPRYCVPCRWPVDESSAKAVECFFLSERAGARARYELAESARGHGYIWS